MTKSSNNSHKRPTPKTIKHLLFNSGATSHTICWLTQTASTPANRGYPKAKRTSMANVLGTPHLNQYFCPGNSFINMNVLVPERLSRDIATDSTYVIIHV